MELTVARIRRLLDGPPDLLREQAFNVLAGISAVSSDGSESLSRDLLIRSLNRRDYFSSVMPMLDSLVRRHGLFPYVYHPEDLGTADQLAYEMHRPVGLEDLVFHAKQAEVYRLLAEGHNVVLSAPTSFGKSLIIDGIIATERYGTIVLIVPTIALIDETRRRLTRKFSSRYKIVTQPSQPPGVKTIYILTQERFLDLPAASVARVDFFAVDEFYKLDSANDERSGLLNCAFHRLHATGAQFYLLGPNIDSLSSDLNEKLNFHFVRTDFQTVALETEIHNVTKSELRTAVVERCRSLSGPTILYVRSPCECRKSHPRYATRRYS